MKKLLILIIWILCVVVSWCTLFKKELNTDIIEPIESGSQAVEITETAETFDKNAFLKEYKFEDENCNKYVNLMACLIDKTPDVAKNQTITSFKKVMDLWNGMEDSALPSTCKNTIDMLNNQKEVFEKAGCSL